ncbi:MAG: DUF5658 family protein [Pirellula sp.]|nr:DUF5658 family protein [Pirellula sp.]
MDPYKVLGISVDASEQEIKRAYLSMASKYHPDHGGDAWVFEQIRIAYEQLTQPTAGLGPTESKPKSETRSPFEKNPKKESPTRDDNDSTPGQSGFSGHSSRLPTGESSDPKHFLNRQLPLQTETSWFILINVLDLVLTNILLQRNAIEANPLANMVFVRYGFTGMIVFKLASVLFVCLAAQIIATKNVSKAKWLLWFGCAVVGAVLIYSCRLIAAMN